MLTLLLTFYCSCALCCGPWADGLTKSGTRATEDWTLACDPQVFPIGTILHIEGLGERMCTDIGSAIRGLHVDVFVGHDHTAHQRARRLGRRTAQAQVLHVGGESDDGNAGS
jgi:3D (Asp-Asp-Asp) domain-containing protein